MLGALIAGLLGWLVSDGTIDLAPEAHADGHGPLASLGGSGSAFYPAGAGEQAWTVGIRLCLVGGSAPAVLDGTVRPDMPVQGGMRYLGAFMRQGVPSSGFFALGSVAMFPPVYPYAGLKQVKGFTVRSHCSDAADPGAAYTELDIGLAPLPGAPGGGWMGVDVGYDAGLRHHVVTLNRHLFMCVAGAPPRYCPRLVTPSPAG